MLQYPCILYLWMVHIHAIIHIIIPQQTKYQLYNHKVNQKLFLGPYIHRFHRKFSFLDEYFLHTIQNHIISNHNLHRVINFQVLCLYEIHCYYVNILELYKFKQNICKLPFHLVFFVFEHSYIDFHSLYIPSPYKHYLIQRNYQIILQCFYDDYVNEPWFLFQFLLTHMRFVYFMIVYT